MCAVLILAFAIYSSGSEIWKIKVVAKIKNKSVNVHLRGRDLSNFSGFPEPQSVDRNRLRFFMILTINIIKYEKDNIVSNARFKQQYANCTG